jgi:hypothetical protein
MRQEFEFALAVRSGVCSVMMGHRSPSFEFWLWPGLGCFCVLMLVGCAQQPPREWPPAPAWLWQDTAVKNLVLERYSEGLSKTIQSSEDRAAIELLVQEFVSKRYADKGGAEKTSIKTKNMTCALPYECVVRLYVHLERWDGYDEDEYYLVFGKSKTWSLLHVYPNGGAILRY